MAESVAKLLVAFATLLGAIAWPLTFLAIVLLFRNELREIAIKIPPLIERIKKGKIGFLELELQEVSDSVPETIEPSGAITNRQVKSAVKIEARADEIGEHELLAQLDRLCMEYDAIRRLQPPGHARTRAMTRVLVQMRVLGLSLSPHIDAYKSSGSAGSRLAAISMMQMKPAIADLSWLVRRFAEEAPFVFYHAALALQNAANDNSYEQRVLIRDAAKEALSIVQSFDGEPDAQSITVLQSIIGG